MPFDYGSTVSAVTRCGRRFKARMDGGGELLRREGRCEGPEASEGLKSSHRPNLPLPLLQGEAGWGCSSENTMLTWAQENPMADPVTFARKLRREQTLPERRFWALIRA